MQTDPAPVGGLVRPADETRVLLVPLTTRDAEAMRLVLAAAGLGCAICPDMGTLCEELQRPPGVVVVSEEALSADPDRLVGHLQNQPVWSDLPVVVLSRSGVETPAVRAVMARLGEITVLERPIRVNTFLSVVRTTLRARERQYQVRDHLAELAAARSEAERISRMKDEFLATLSHELRTPLNAILGWTQILKGDPADAEGIAEGLEIIERNARVQTQIIEDLLDMSRIINGKVSLVVEQLNLAAVVRTAIETVRPAADAKAIQVETVLETAGSLVNGDPNRLQQVFWNLFSNAVKFTPRGGRVRVTLDRAESHLRVSVSDSGEGIDPLFLPHVFDRFRQADASTTRRHGGLGLGLSIVKQLIELHGGTVRAASTGNGAGSTFTVSIPPSALIAEEISPVGKQARSTNTVQPKGKAFAIISGIRVLVVDDEFDARGMLQRLLQDRGAIVTTADSAHQAYQFLTEESYDVLVSDIGMPGEDGYALIQKIRLLDSARGGGLPAIALTAYARPDDRAKALGAGYQSHLPKPVEPADLVGAISRLTSVRAAV